MHDIDFIKLKCFFVFIRYINNNEYIINNVSKNKYPKKEIHR